MATRRRSVDDVDAPPPPPTPVENILPCIACGNATPRAILGQHGGRCAPCYDAHCRSGPCGGGESPRVLTRDEKAALVQRVSRVRMRSDPREWARQVIARHEAGEHVSVAVLAMARAALPWRPTPPNVDDGWSDSLS